MSKRDAALYLSDIKNCIKNIQKYIKGMTFEKFSRDQKTIDAVVRNIEVIGEAAKNIPVDIRRKYPNVPWEKVIGMRNIIDLSLNNFSSRNAAVLSEKCEERGGLMAKLSQRALNILQPKPQVAAERIIKGRV